MGHRQIGRSLERCTGKLVRSVLRGRRHSNVLLLPDKHPQRMERPGPADRDMVTSYPDENARLRAQLLEPQNILRQMVEYNRLLSQRVAAYASEINRLKALVAKLQRMHGKSSEKLRGKTARQVREAEERISARQEEMTEVLGEQHDPVLPPPLRQSSARKPLPASVPREMHVLPPKESACPGCGGDLSPLGCDISEQLRLQGNRNAAA